ncbi:hypothetical protein IWX49DRAFT_93846 [Phyllosticta citricarpa]
MSVQEQHLLVHIQHLPLLSSNKTHANPPLIPLLFLSTDKPTSTNPRSIQKMELHTWIECIALFTFINHLPWVFFPAPPASYLNDHASLISNPSNLFIVTHHTPFCEEHGDALFGGLCLWVYIITRLIHPHVGPALGAGVRWLDWQLLILLFKGVAVYNRVMWYVRGVRDALKLLWGVVYGKLAAALWRADKEAFLLLVQVAAAVDWVKRFGRDLVKVFWPTPRVSALDERAKGPKEFGLM